jgi:hypothetical protein
MIANEDILIPLADHEKACITYIAIATIAIANVRIAVFLI